MDPWRGVVLYTWNGGEDRASGVLTGYFHQPSGADDTSRLVGPLDVVPGRTLAPVAVLAVVVGHLLLGNLGGHIV